MAEQWTSDRKTFLTPTGRTGIMSVEQFNASGFGKEAALQVACVDWFRKTHPDLSRSFYSSLNGADLVDGDRQWHQLEREGALAGVADLFLAVPSGDLCGLYLELKTRRGKQSAEQLAFEAAQIEQGYGYVMPRSLRHFQKCVTQYLEDGTY